MQNIPNRFPIWQFRSPNLIGLRSCDLTSLSADSKSLVLWIILSGSKHQCQSVRMDPVETSVTAEEENSEEVPQTIELEEIFLTPDTQ